MAASFSARHIGTVLPGGRCVFVVALVILQNASDVSYFWSVLVLQNQVSISVLEWGLTPHSTVCRLLVWSHQHEALHYMVSGSDGVRLQHALLAFRSATALSIPSALFASACCVDAATDKDVMAGGDKRRMPRHNTRRDHILPGALAMDLWSLSDCFACTGI